MDQEKLSNAFAKALQAFKKDMVSAVVGSGGLDEDLKRLERGMPAIGHAVRDALDEHYNGSTSKWTEPQKQGWPIPDNRPAALLTAWVTYTTALWPADVCMVEFGTYKDMVEHRKGQEIRIKEEDRGVTLVDTIMVASPADDDVAMAFTKQLEYLLQNPKGLHAIQRVAAEIWRTGYTMNQRRYSR